jgi:uncharacterized protein CbrC (UPF0167 family)
MVSSNVPTGRHHGAPKHGDALLAGLIRCNRCGHKLMLKYTGAKHGIPRYSCSRAWMDNGAPHCIAFGGLAQRLPRAAKLLHLVEDQRDRLLHTPVWTLLIAVPGLHEAHRRADDKLPSARLLVAGG